MQAEQARLAGLQRAGGVGGGHGTQVQPLTTAALGELAQAGGVDAGCGTERIERHTARRHHAHRAPVGQAVAEEQREVVANGCDQRGQVARTVVGQAREHAAQLDPAAILDAELLHRLGHVAAHPQRDLHVAQRAEVGVEQGELAAVVAACAGAGGVPQQGDAPGRGAGRRAQ